MSWWNSTPKQDNGKSPAELSKNISQPVTEMIRRIDEEDRVTITPILSNDHESRYVDFLLPDGFSSSRLIAGWYKNEDDYSSVMHQAWMTKVEEVEFVKAVKRYITKTDSARNLSEREEWCKLMGVSNDNKE